MISSEQVAWCAGVIDALGHLRTRKMDTGSELAVVQISSPKIDLLERLSELTGTKVVIVRRDYNRLGCGEHCTDAHQHVHSTTGRWQLVGARAIVFLNAIEPYLTVQQDAVSATLSLGETAPVSDATLEKMYKLGWPRLDDQ